MSELKLVLQGPLELCVVRYRAPQHNLQQAKCVPFINFLKYQRAVCVRFPPHVWSWNGRQREPGRAARRAGSWWRTWSRCLITLLLLFVYSSHFDIWQYWIHGDNAGVHIQLTRGLALTLVANIWVNASKLTNCESYVAVVVHGAVPEDRHCAGVLQRWDPFQSGQWERINSFPRGWSHLSVVRKCRLGAHRCSISFSLVWKTTPISLKLNKLICDITGVLDYNFPIIPKS